MKQSNSTPTNQMNVSKCLLIFFAFLISFLLHLLLFSTAPMVDLIMDEMKLSHTAFGFIFSIAMVSLVILRIPWGFLSDKFGYVTVLRASLPLITIPAIVRSFSDTYLTFLISQFLLGIGLASILPCLPLIIKEWNPEQTGLGTGVYVSGFALGNGTALGLTPYLLEMMPWRLVLRLYALVAVVTTLLWWSLAKSTYQGKDQFALDAFTDILQHKYIWVLTSLMIACMGCYDTLATWMPKVLELKTQPKYPAVLLSIGFLLGGPTTGAVSDEFPSKSILVGFLGVAAVVSIIGIAYTVHILLMICIFLASFFITGILTLTLEAPAKLPRFSLAAGKVSGIISSLGNIGPVALPVSFGFLIDYTGTYHSSLFMVAMVAFVIFILGASMWENA
ncbi:MAG: MFS transporter [Candidatus Korarchaeota archaeon]|nr:MFS transporter [Candidatus Korarchaeota archaeon]NIU82961.1 MFS transporter [Candidatus Thorarchaeota archaeon]